MNNHSDSWRILPDGDDKCIWMAAGVVRYKLCDREFECDDCPFDRELRRTTSSNDSPSHSPIGEMIASERSNDDPESLALFDHLKSIPIRSDYLYSSNHIWARHDDASGMTLGLDAFAVRILPRRHSFILPQVSTSVRRGEPIAWIQAATDTLTFYSPIDCTITAINDRVIESPSICRESPYDEGWLLHISAGDGKSKLDFMESERYAKQMQSDLLRFRTACFKALKRDRTGLGPLLNDGGVAVQDMAEALGWTRYITLIAPFFRLTIHRS